MMIGYLNQPKSNYFDDEGFGRTGDIGYYDENGVFYYVERLKEVIKYESVQTINYCLAFCVQNCWLGM